MNINLIIKPKGDYLYEARAVCGQINMALCEGNLEAMQEFETVYKRQMQGLGHMVILKGVQND